MVKKKASAPRKNPAAVALSKLRMTKMTAEERSAVGRSGGLKGGPARAKKLGKKRVSEIAKKAAAARWAKKREGKPAE
jgi:hypothetical protein